MTTATTHQWVYYAPVLDPDRSTRDLYREAAIAWVDAAMADGVIVTTPTRIRTWEGAGPGHDGLWVVVEGPGTRITTTTGDRS